MFKLTRKVTKICASTSAFSRLAVGSAYGATWIYRQHDPNDSTQPQNT